MRFHSIPIRDILKEAVHYGGLIVDVRSSEEFLNGHIPMAINVPIDDIKNGNYSLPKGKHLLLYCKYGGASALASKLLSEAGYQVINTVGGLVQYRGALSSKK